MAKEKKQTEEIADKTYEPAYYQSNDEIEQGLATTHEQVSDAYMEGTVDGEIDDLDSKDKQIPRQE
ncbi:YozQ family protein [Bacillus sp. FJAT-45350]|uniref:YozQ family protein n=1 Tax=Bacillus sp. FJAT-45350 TaxID=2011014 RepID=UPI000BB8DA51|nr:YozQ family protein [Bacillus sp. FJAT-45350]